ncbi:MAG: response regulator [Candidatus Omnitrophica bacterium]|nr:response regulator [Candidatus Omnitrophota bacterium]
MISAEAILNAKVLIVEDDKVSRRILETILLSSGFRNVRAIPNAKRIRKIYATFQPDLLILDLGLPGIDGFQVMRYLKDDQPDDYLPILVITSESDERVHLRALAGGAKDFLTKPYDRPKVLLRARNLIEVRLLYRELCGKNDELEQRVRERTKELRNSRLDVIRRLGYAAECRDNETGQHIVRMSRYCACLARASGMSDEECDLVLATTPLHDVGKIAIPDAILLKPGPLTPEEWAVMKTHPVVGAEILSGGDSPFLRMAEMIARGHHERWDGTGYPSKIKGDQIPLPARICAVCDVFDALTSDRPYKKAWSVDDAVKEIRKMSEVHFDPMVVDTFMAILPEIRSIKREVDALARELSKERQG